MKTCESCGRPFAVKQLIDGKVRTLSSRRFCLDCSPFGGHNTSSTPPGQRDVVIVRKERRNAAWQRYQKKRLGRFKAGLLRLKGGRCADCGYSKEIGALEFHHHDGLGKEFQLGGFKGSWDRAVAEVAKCELLCANCHRIRHVADHDRESRHSVTRWRRRRKERAIQSRGSRCERCGFAGHRGALEFHHRDGADKSFGISERGITRSWARVQAELVKCVLLCANCHREVHAGATLASTPGTDPTASPAAPP